MIDTISLVSKETKNMTLFLVDLFFITVSYLIQKKNREILSGSNILRCLTSKSEILND